MVTRSRQGLGSLPIALSVGLAATLLAPAPVRAAVLVKHMNLEELAMRAQRIFSGTVVAVEKGTVAIGGGTLPTVTYRVAVDTPFHGRFAEKGGQRVAEVRMVDGGGVTHTGHWVRFPALPAAPEIQVGERCVLFVSAPGRAGLSTTVGLGQGLFRISGKAGDEDVVNDAGNVGLFRGMAAPVREGPTPRGPMKLRTLRDRINALMVRK